MNYIINPWIIYLIDRADAIKSLFVILAALATAALFCIIPVLFVDRDDYEACISTTKKVGKVSGIILTFSVIFLILFPNSQTITKMVVASYVTEENVEKAKDQVVEIVDYIFEKVNDVNKED